MKAWGLIFVLWSAISALAQDVAPPPKPTDNGPTLADTMQFIQDKIASNGAVNYISYYHDNIAGTNWTNKWTAEVTQVQADAANCQVRFHEKETRDGQVTRDGNFWFLLKDVLEISVEPAEQSLKRADSSAGHPEYTSRTDPPVFFIHVTRKAGPNEIRLYDESLANRIAKALVHAVELCGGGNKDPF